MRAGPGGKHLNVPSTAAWISAFSSSLSLAAAASIVLSILFVHADINGNVITIDMVGETKATRAFLRLEPGIRYTSRAVEPSLLRPNQLRRNSYERVE
jgi:hypothetical protein